jgi:transposase-like protein
MKDASVFTTLGINLEGRKSILGFWLIEGDESRAFWGDVFQDLITRGLRRVLIFITDDFPGVREIVRKLYPFFDHQLCFLNMQRNLRIDLPKRVYAELKLLLYLAKESQTKEDGLKHFNDACSIVERTDRSYAERLRGRADNYLSFLTYPVEVRKFIYTTNAVESIHSGLDYIRRELGGYFPSRESLDVNYFVQIVNMNDSWMKAPVPMISSRSYELRQPAPGDEVRAQGGGEGLNDWRNPH